VRLFLALPIPREIGVRLAVAPGAREEWPRAAWVEPEALHLTLVFFGERLDSELEPLIRGLGAAPAAPLRTVRIAGAGAFPERGAMRVVWLGVGPAAELTELSARYREAARAAGVEFDTKPFRPHLTLARCRPPWPTAWRQRLAALAPAGPVDFAPPAVTLFRSTLSSAGAQHEPVARFPAAA
jgi:RNA 2',3'-cyclic 3'-phosphodiesterase